MWSEQGVHESELGSYYNQLNKENRRSRLLGLCHIRFETPNPLDVALKDGNMSAGITSVVCDWVIFRRIRRAFDRAEDNSQAVR